MGPLLRRLIASVAALMLLPAAAAATAPTTPPTPSPVAGTLTLRLPDLFLVRKQLVAVQARGFTVEGQVRPYVPGQSVTVQERIGKRTVKRVRVTVASSSNPSFGRFTVHLQMPATGSVTVTAIHTKSATQLGFRAQRRFLAVARDAHFGSTGKFVQLIQERLDALHFYVPQSGVYDGGTGLAVDAYHRLLGWGTSPNLDSRTITYLLNGWGQFKVRFPSHGRHAEGNLHNQLLALIDGKNVQLIFPISSGKPSTPTVLGDFHIYRRVPGYLPDGMYYSSFFTGGYAIHGFNPAPDYPASHGCMRVPIADAITIYNWLAMGDWVDVYY